MAVPACVFLLRVYSSRSGLLDLRSMHTSTLEPHYYQSVQVLAIWDAILGTALGEVCDISALGSSGTTYEGVEPQFHTPENLDPRPRTLHKP